MAVAQAPITNPPVVQPASYSVPTARSRVPDRFSKSNSADPTGRPITPPGQTSPQSQTRSGSLVTSLIALLGVMAIAAIAHRLIKKNGGIRSGLPAEAVEVLGHKVLAHRQAIQIVRVGTRILVLNSSAEGLSTLSEITDPMEVAALEHSCRLVPPSNSIVDLFAPRQKTTPRGSRSRVPAVRDELHRDRPLGDVHA